MLTLYQSLVIAIMNFELQEHASRLYQRGSVKHWPNSAVPIMVETSAVTAVLKLAQSGRELRERACLITLVKHP